MSEALRRCPLSYEPLAPGEPLYSGAGLRRLSRSLTHLAPLAFTASPGGLLLAVAELILTGTCAMDCQGRMLKTTT